MTNYVKMVVNMGANNMRATERTYEGMYVRVCVRASVRASVRVSVRPYDCTVTRHVRARVRENIQGTPT